MDIQAIYEDKYSSFASLPYYNAEKRFYGLQFKLFLEHLDDKNVAKKSLIDLGCGFGMKSHIMKSYFDRVLGVDFAHNIIEVNTLLSSDPGLTFATVDLNKAESTDKKFDYIVANGLSLFNDADIKKCSDHLMRMINLYGRKKGTFVIWSFSDFSGKAPSGWHNHTKRELSAWLSYLTAEHQMKCSIFYPYKKIGFSSGSLKEILIAIYRYFRKRQYYFISIQYEF